MVLFPPRPRQTRNSGKVNLERLDVLCSHTATHPLPVKMKCIGVSTSNKGAPMAVYACPFRGCSRREGWVQNGRGKAFRLWRRNHRRSQHRRR